MASFTFRLKLMASDTLYAHAMISWSGCRPRCHAGNIRDDNSLLCVTSSVRPMMYSPSGRATWMHWPILPCGSRVMLMNPGRFFGISQ